MRLIDANAFMRDLLRCKKYNSECPLEEEQKNDWKINNYDTGQNETFDLVIERLEKQPTIENRDEWILCSDRLPTKEECKDRRKFFQVTINTENNTSLLMQFVYKKVNDEELGEWIWLGQSSPWEVVAWKPWDNEPYREVE